MSSAAANASATPRESAGTSGTADQLEDIELGNTGASDGDARGSSYPPGGDDNESEKSKELRSIGEEAWNHKHEALAEEWMQDAKEASAAHNIKAKEFKCKHVSVGLPAVILPIAMAPISSTLADEPGIQYANMSAFLVTGILSAVHAFFGFDKKYQQHMDFSARYSALYTDLRYELTKARRFRAPADEFLTRVQMKIDHLGSIAPDL